MSDLGLGIPDAGSDLDALLREFEESARRSPPPRLQREAPSASPPLSPELGALGQQLDSIKQQMSDDRTQREAAAESRDIAEAVRALRAEAEIPDGYSDKILVGYLNQLTLDDPGVLRAWQERAEQPRQWQHMLSTAAEQLRQSNGRLRTERDDIARAMASVRGLVTEPSPQPQRNPTTDFRMTDSQWAEVQAAALRGR